MTEADNLVEELAVAICATDGLDYHEVCGREADPDLDECDSGSCPAAYWEEHDAEDARAMYRKYAKAALPIIQRREAEALAAKDAQIAELERECDTLSGLVQGWHYLAVGPDEMGDYHTQKQLIKLSEPYASPALKALKEKNDVA